MSDGGAELMTVDGRHTERKSQAGESQDCDCDGPASVPAQAARELHEKLRPVLQSVPATQRAGVERGVVSVVTEVVEEYSGPVLHPRLARGWEELCPGAADRLLTMTERQLDHRIRWERSGLAHSATSHYLGLLCALLISLSLVGGAIYCATISQPWVSAAFLATSAVGMVKAFLGRKDPKDTEPPEQPAQAPALRQKGASAASKKPHLRHRR